jgi:hypothetical protein
MEGCALRPTARVEAAIGNLVEAGLPGVVHG